jgi:hypothetical protein
LHGDSLKSASEEREGLFGDFVQVAGARLKGGELGECGKLIDEGAEGANAAENHRAALANNLRGIGYAAIS